MKNEKREYKEGDEERITASEFKDEMTEIIQGMTNKEALNFWNNVIVKHAPTIALKVITKIDNLKQEGKDNSPLE